MGLAALRARAKERPPKDIQHGAAQTSHSLSLHLLQTKITAEAAQVILHPLGQMEDFEYSLEISDRDWEFFFTECEECNLLPPSLAGVDDSGMSDIDDKGSIFAKRVQKVELPAGVSVTDRSVDAPPDCEGSPVAQEWRGGMESVLSGSEEDIHLQSVNMFFERLKNVAEPEKLTEPCQVRAGRNREAAQEDEECCSDGQQASTALPKNIPKLNCLYARGETAVGKETLEPVDNISNITKTMKKYEPASNFSPEPAAGYSALKTHKSAHPESKLFITEETCTETRVNGATQRSHTPDSPNRLETTPHCGKVKVEMCTPPDDVKQEDLLTSQSTLGKKFSTDSWSNVEMVTNVKWEQDLNVSRSDTTSTNKTTSQESSPSASMRRKRRKKRRLSAEPGESGCVVKPSDSEEEPYAWRGGAGLSMSEDVNLFYIYKPQKHVMSSLPTYAPPISVPPVKTYPSGINVNDLSHRSPCYSQYHWFPDSVVREDRCKQAGLDEKNATNERSVTPLSHTDQLTTDRLMSASNNSGNVATHLQPCSKLQVEESTGLNKYPELSVSVTEGVTGESCLDTDTVVCGIKDGHAGSLWQSDKMNHSGVCLESEQNPEWWSAEVKPLTHSILPSTESNDPTVEVGQNDKLSAAKSVLAEEAGNCGRDERTLCQREAEPQQQLEIDCHYTDLYSSTLEKTQSPLCADGTSSSDNTKQLKARACPFLEISTQEDRAELTLDNSDSLPDEPNQSKSLPSLEINTTVQQTEHPLVRHTSSTLDVSTEKDTAKAALARSQVMPPHSGSPFLSAETNVADKTLTEARSSEDLSTCLSDFTTVSSYCTLDTESVMSLSNENITDMSGSLCLSVSQNDFDIPGETTSPKLARHEDGDTPGPSGPSVLNDAADSLCDLLVKAEDAVTASKAPCGPETSPKPSVFAMSSFWSEMEKLTINDILGLRMISKASSPGSLPPLRECEEANMFALTDSGFFTQPDEPKNREANKDPPGNTNSVESSSVSSRGVLWESEPAAVSPCADIYTENMMLPSVTCDISQPALPGSAQTRLRKICKNVSVHNLHALESISYTWKGQSLKASDEGLEQVEYFTDAHVPKQDKDCLTSSVTDSYRISLTDIFQYFFGGKQSNHSQPATDTITTCFTDGNSVPETYDHFFSEFDTESFFYPLITAKEQAKDELVPVFSYSRSVNKNLQFPEAYDYFFASSSSDDSDGSDEEDNCGPVRVVNRFSRTSSVSKISTDVYENFFTDTDLRQNFFWKNALSLRNITFTGSTVQRKTVSNPLVPVKQSSRSLQRTVYPINALGNQDVMFPDPLLYHLEERISSQLAQQPFKYDDLQMAVSNPRLDASFLPLRQSDMCLVCIAFASWVLKTANPQVGDTWKAVLLANVSALSAIRYLRKYVKLEAAASERKLHLPAPSGS